MGLCTEASKSKAQSIKIHLESFFFNSTQQVYLLFHKWYFRFVYITHKPILFIINGYWIIYYLINVITYNACFRLLFLFFVNSDGHIFPQNMHVVGKIEIDTAILLKLFIYE